MDALAPEPAVPQLAGGRDPREGQGKWTYLFRAVAKDGRALDFRLSDTRKAEAAKRFNGADTTNPLSSGIERLGLTPTERGVIVSKSGIIGMVWRTFAASAAGPVRHTT